MGTAAKFMRNEFQDILYDRRYTSDVWWASRDWQPVSAYIQPHKSSATQIKSTVYNSYRLKQVISEISQEQNIPQNELYKQVEDILNEMGYSRQVSVLRWLGVFTAKILKKLCSGILVNERKLLEIKSQMGRNPVLFVPSHRSYGDFILMSYICFHYDLDIPRIAAGMDFHSMVLMGRILRDSCAFFMRRSFNNDKLYSAIFSQYVQTLVTDGDGAVEFFIEGTRSRTAKSLMPKFGFLSMALKPFFTGLVPDISIVPVNISYDRALEEVLFAYELLGVPKPKESTKGFVKALSILNENYGNVYVQFGDPFSVKDYFGRKVDRSLHNFGPVQLQDLTPSESKQIVDLAHTVVDKQKQLTVLTSFNLIAAVVNNNIINREKPLQLDALTLEVAWLLSVMKKLNVLVGIEDDIEKSVILALELHKSLVTLSTTNEIHIRRVHLKSAPSNPSKLKGHALSSSTMDLAVPLLMMQNYVNPCCNFLISICIIVLVLEFASISGAITKDKLFEEFQFLRSIFSYEFVFHAHFFEEDFETALKNSNELRLISISGPNNQVAIGGNEKLRKFCVNFFKPFMPGYLTVAEVLLEISDSGEVDSSILKSSQKRLENKLACGVVPHPGSLSLDLLANALQAFVALEVVAKSKKNGATRYFAAKDRLRSVLNHLSIFDEKSEPKTPHAPQFASFINAKL